MHCRFSSGYINGRVRHGSRCFSFVHFPAMHVRYWFTVRISQRYQPGETKMSWKYSLICVSVTFYPFHLYTQTWPTYGQDVCVLRMKFIASAVEKSKQTYTPLQTDRAKWITVLKIGCLNCRFLKCYYVICSFLKFLMIHRWTEPKTDRSLEVLLGNYGFVQKTRLRAHLHQASASTQSQHWDDACDTALIEINGNKELLQNGVATHFGVTPFFSMRAMSQVMLKVGVNGP